LKQLSITFGFNLETKDINMFYVEKNPKEIKILKYNPPFLLLKKELLTMWY
jgi:hypothetical protein